ncbi:MAG TPA: Wzz/FepE/Etk N-terminal domain-containing protein, partial [Adhaeribacter sp.]|nr:Wzz/FepE/Etk N-terminal domain-containing protein [Adhaeribacter sp.]
MASIHNAELDELERRPAVLDSEEENEGTDFDLATLILVVRKSLIWLILLVSLGLFASYLVIRYTPKVYQSTSLIKIDEQSEAGVLGLNTIGNMGAKNSYSQLSGEIELLKSNLIYDELRQTLSLDVNYYVQGNVLDQEIYTDTPFNVIFNIKSESIYDRKINIDFLDMNRYSLSYLRGEDTYIKEGTIGEIITTPELELKVLKTSRFSEHSIGQNFFFKINSTGAIMGYLGSNLSALIVNPDARTISISFTDHNPVKARDIVNRVDSVYLQQKRERKNQSNEQTISFLRDQLDETRNQLQTAEANLEAFAKENRSYDIKSDVSAFREKVNQLQQHREELRQKLALLDEVGAMLDRDSKVDQVVPTLTALEDPQISQKISELGKLQDRREVVLSSNQPGTFAVTSLETQIQKLKRDVRDLLQRNRDLLQSQIVSINANAGTIESELMKLPQRETEATRLRRMFELYEKFYLLLMEKQVEF